jgi:hypothetical protein
MRFAAKRWSAMGPSTRTAPPSSRTSSAPATDDRLAVQQAEGIYAGIDLLRTRPTPAPLSKVHRGARALNMEAGELIIGAEDEVEG